MAEEVAPVTKRKRERIIDTMAYMVGIGGNVAVVPQIIKAWAGKAPGLAVATWALFVAISCIWLAYAVIHRQKPLIVAQVVGLSCNIAVVAGWVLNNWVR